MARNIKGITIEIDGKTTKLQNALSDVNKNINSTKNGLWDVEKLLKLDPNNTILLEQKQRMLAEAVDSTKDKLNMLEQAAESANKQLADGEITQEQYDNLQREIIDTSNKLKKLEADTKDFAESNSLLGKVSAGFKDIGAQAEKAGEKVKAAGEKISSAGKEMTTKVSGGIITGGTAAVVKASNYEDSVAKVSTVADESVPTEKLSEDMLELSDTTGIAATKIAENVYDAISAGQDTADAVDFVGKSSKLAASGFADSGDALNVLTTILNAYGMEAEKATDVSDMLVQAQNMGKTTVGELAQNMGKVIPTAKSFNVGLEQITAAYAKTTANGIGTAESTTYINSMLNELGKSGTNVSNVLKEKTGKSFAELMKDGYSLNDVLGIIKEDAEASGKQFSDMWSSSEAGKAANVLVDTTNKLGDFNGAVDAMKNSSGATDEAYKKMQTNSRKVKVAVNQLMNSLIVLGKTILGMLAPYIDLIGQKIRQFTEWFKNLDESQKQMIVKIGLIIAAIGPALMITGKIVSTVGTVISVAGKVISIGGTIIGGIGKIASAIRILSGVAVQMGGMIIGIVGKVGGAIKILFGIMAANPIGVIVVLVGVLIATFMYLWHNCEAFRKFWINLWASIVGKVKSGIHSVKETINNAVSFLKGLKDKAVTWGKDFIGGFIDGIKEKAAQLTGKIGEIADSIASFLHFSRPEKGPLHYYEQWMPDFMKGMAEGIDNNKYRITDSLKALSSDMTLNPTASIVMMNPDRNYKSEFAALRTEVRRLGSHMDNMQVVMDSGATVGALAPGMDNALGKMRARKERGN